MTSETVIYEFSGVTLKEEKLYKRVVLDKTITISEKQLDVLWDKYINKSFSKDELKKDLGF